MTPEEILQVEKEIVLTLKNIYDPEIPVDIFNMGLIYNIDIDDEANLKIDMTLTAPNCPAADFIVEDARIKLESIEGIKSVDIRIVFEPEWNKDMMSEEAKLDLGFL
ncbi:MAG: iron-sulfur cluster assembly protein [Alistipes sp.]|nr:iron-sulfur cluster assembly protein [Alistipes sp.]